MELGTIIKNKATGERGIVVADIMDCCSEGELPIVYDGDTAFTGTRIDRLEIIGKYDGKADQEKCGAGKGSDCCIFLMVDKTGFCCERFGVFRNQLIFKSMNAQRHPKEVYPDCMNQGEPDGKR